MGLAQKVETIGPDNAKLEQKWLAKSRPYPYDVTVQLVAVANVAANTFGNYLLVFNNGTYNFGDTPNYLIIRSVSIENMSANDTYVLELYRESGGVYTPIGAVRFSRTSAQTRAFVIVFWGREVNADTEKVYARVKSALGASTATFSVMVIRHLSVSQHITTSGGVFPFG